jgi:hypothetical protein
MKWIEWLEREEWKFEAFGSMAVSSGVRQPPKEEEGVII